MAYGQWNASYNIPFGPMSFGAPGWSIVANVTTIINPTLTNEFVFGSSRNDLHITPITDAFNASKVGVSYTMPFPDADKLKLVQNWNYRRRSERAHHRFRRHALPELQPHLRHHG